MTSLSSLAAATWLQRWSILMEQPDELRDRLPALNIDNPPPPTADLITYYNAYGFNLVDYQHIVGTFNSGDFELVAHVIMPRSPRGTVLLLHGFLDHSGTLSDTADHLLTQGYAVAAYDLPGHGVSSGRRTHIEDFDDYHRSLGDFLQLVQASLPPPYHAVAHSTGAAILVDRLLSEEDTFTNVVLVAPLVRSALWHLSTKSADVFDTFFKNVPRVFRDNTSDEAFLEAVRNDPMQSRKASLGWVDALVEWNKSIDDYPPNNRPIVIIQGDDDSVIDWDYNLEFLEQKFPNARIEMIENGKHQLLGESPELRSQVYGFIDQALAQPQQASSAKSGTSSSAHYLPPDAERSKMLGQSGR